MQKGKWIGAMVALSMVMGWAAMAGAGTENPKVKPGSAVVVAPAAKDAWAICPVQKTKILKTKAVDTVVYKKQTYYFCCAGCKPEFLKNPDKYLK
jgi:xanthine dehydrogenase accessory factor